MAESTGSGTGQRPGLVPRVDFVKLLIVVGAPLLVVVSQLLPVAANGEAVEVFRGRQGGYEVVVAIRPETPAVGTVHFSVTPLDADTSELVADAEVVIVARHESGDPAYILRALNSPSSPRYYETNILFEEPGEWTITLTVTSEGRGEADLELPLTVEAPSIEAGTAGAFVFLAVLLTLAGGSLYLWRTARRRQEERDSPPH